MRSVSYYGTPQSNKLLNVCTQKDQAYYFHLHHMWTTKWLSRELKIEAHFEHVTVYSSSIQCSLSFSVFLRMFGMRSKRDRCACVCVSVLTGGISGKVERAISSALIHLCQQSLQALPLSALHLSQMWLSTCCTLFTLFFCSFGYWVISLCHSTFHSLFFPFCIYCSLKQRRNALNH